MSGGYRFFMHSRKLPGFREAVKPRPVGGDRSRGATFFLLRIRKAVLYVGEFITAGILTFFLDMQAPFSYKLLENKN